MTASPQDRARVLVDELVANGARFAYRPASGAMPASFTYDLPAGGNRQACRATISPAKGDAAIWRALVAEIGARCHGGAR